MKLTTKNLTHVLLTGAMACALAMLALGSGRATAQNTEPAAKAKARKTAKRRPSSVGAASADRDYPVVRTGLSLLGATAALLGLVVMILFGFRSK